MERFWGRKCAKNGSEAAQIRERRPFWPLNLGAHKIMHEIYPGHLAYRAPLPRKAAFKSVKRAPGAPCGRRRWRSSTARALLSSFCFCYSGNEQGVKDIPDGVKDIPDGVKDISAAGDPPRICHNM